MGFLRHRMMRIATASGPLLAAMAIGVMAGCSTSSSSDGVTTTSTASLPKAPWETHPAIRATGTNETILANFGKPMPPGTCRPLGTEPAIWTPHAGDQEAGFLTRSLDPNGAAQTSEDFVRVAKWSKVFADGSVAMARHVPAGDTLQIAVPTATPSTWCVYGFEIKPGDSMGQIVESVRYLQRN